VARLFDWFTLRLESESFVADDLAREFADLLFSIRPRGTNEIPLRVHQRCCRGEPARRSRIKPIVAYRFASWSCAAEPQERERGREPRRGSRDWRTLLTL
jgi:hypothetical protein